ncbi:MAG: Rrf2 family transcriptional regulator [Rhodospirillaceae bacterium]|nr:Rrf2 family transcriptional regulator [Rhodospirillaceae bacterium]
MRLTNFSNYALRVLMYAAAKHPAPATVPEIAQAHGISYNHLKKAAASLCGAGYLDAVRGRRGGLRLARPAETIVVGDVIRLTEGGLTLVECFDPQTSTCPMSSGCQLQTALHEALQAFLAVLDTYTLADLVDRSSALSQLVSGLGLEEIRQPMPAA